MKLFNQILLTFLIMFAVLYIFFNMNSLGGNIFGGVELKKPLLISLIGTLLFYLYMTWEQDDNNVPSYSIANRKFNMNNSNRMNFMNDLSNNELSIFSKQPFGNAY
jgi:hypothetical protein